MDITIYVECGMVIRIFGHESQQWWCDFVLLGGLLQVSSAGTIDLKSGVSVTMNLKEGIYAFYDNYAISGFILTVSSSLFTNRSVIIAGDKSPSLSIEFGSDGATFQSNINRMLNYRLLAYYKWFVVSGGTGLYRTTHLIKIYGFLLGRKHLLKAFLLW